jgi:O-antigen ligase
LLRRVDRLIGHLLSFEMAFALFLYSNELKTILPVALPVDETIITGGLAVAAGVFVVAREGLYLRGVPVVATALLFIGWAVLSVTWTPSQTLAPKSAAYLLTFTLLSIVGGALVIANRRERLIRFLVIALGISLLMAVYGIYIYLVYGDFRRWAGWQDWDGRAYLAFGHTVVNGAGTAFVIALFARFGSVRQGVAIALFGVCMFFLLVGGGRGPFLGGILAAMIGLACRPPELGRNKLNIPYATVAAVAVIALTAAYSGYLVVSGNLTTTLSRFAKLFNDAGMEKANDGYGRLDFYAGALRFWLQAPFFGNGLDSFSFMFLHGREREGFHPHNIFLQMLAELGVLGLLLFMLFFWSAYRYVPYRRLQRDPLMVCALLFMITSAMSALFGRDIVGVRKFFFAISLFALRPPVATRSETATPDDEALDAETPARRRKVLRPRRTAGFIGQPARDLR